MAIAKRTYGKELYDSCGTYKGVNRHNKEKTRLCAPCTGARADYVRELRHRNGTSKGTWVYVPDPQPLTADHYVI